MGITKQAFYEGAAIYLLARTGRVKSLSYADPFFMINGATAVLLKYSTRVRSPWGFTFTAAEQRALRARAAVCNAFIGLVCGGDGIAALAHEDFAQVAPLSSRSLHLSCYRKHREHFEINGPAGVLASKIAPSNWTHILEARP
jgi:hypothetical protein